MHRIFRLVAPLLVVMVGVACSTNADEPGEDTTDTTLMDSTDSIADTGGIDTAPSDVADSLQGDGLTGDGTGGEVTGDTTVEDGTEPQYVVVSTTCGPAGDNPDCDLPCGNGVCGGDGLCDFTPKPDVCIITTGLNEVTCVPGGGSDGSGELFCTPSILADHWTGTFARLDFEDEDGSVVMSDLSGSSVVWHTSEHRSSTGSTSLYAGVEGEWTYDVGSHVQTRASMSVAVPQGMASVVVSFALWMETEGSTGYDVLTVVAKAGADSIVVFDSDDIEGNTFGTFVEIERDIGPVDAELLELVFTFDTTDEKINAFEGVYIDDLRVGSGKCAGTWDCQSLDSCLEGSCPSPGGTCSFEAIEDCCNSSVDCYDDNECTVDTCPVPGGQCVNTPIEDCCLDDADCDDSDDCTEDSCETNIGCVHVPLCCDTDADCNDGDGCTEGSCVDGACHYDFTCCLSDDECDDGELCTNDRCILGECQHLPAILPGCCASQVYSEAFDDNDSGADWTLSPPTGGVGWQVVWSNNQKKSAPGSLYYGNPATGDFDSGGANSGIAESPPFTIMSSVETSLSMQIYLDIDSWYDDFSVSLVYDDGEVELYSYSGYSSGWVSVTSDLTFFGGRTVSLKFSFATEGDAYWTSEGVYVDDISVVSTCTPKQCTSASQCKSYNSCWAGSCISGACFFVYSCCNGDDECDDGDSCTTDSCVNGKCAFIPIEDCCHDTAADCVDNNPCTEDICPGDGGICYWTDIPGCCIFNSECTDADSCTMDMCIDNVCQHQNTCCLVDGDCDDGDDVCTVESCVEGSCVWTPTGADGCCDESVVTFDFEDGTPQGFFLDPGQDGVGWTISDYGPKSGTFSLYYGDPQSIDYYTGGANEGSAVSPPFQLPPMVASSLSFQLDTEISYYNGDVVSVYVIGPSGKYLLYTEDGSTYGYDKITKDLTFFAGQTVQLEFHFTTDYSSSYNDGIFVDDVVVTSTCLASTCTTGSDCISYDSCLAGACLEGTCSFVDSCCDSDAECDDGDVCTVDACGSNGKCTFEDIEDCCEGSAVDCDDNDPCTIDTCPGVGAICQWEEIPGCCVYSFDCNDDDACTKDVCVDNECTYKTLCCTTDGECDDGDDVCTVDSCVDGSCVWAPTGVEGCCAEVQAAMSFEDGTGAGWTFDALDSGVGWQVASGGESFDGSYALYYGNVSTWNYDTGYQNYGTALSPPIELYAGVDALLSFQYWQDTESGMVYDSLSLSVLVDGSSYEVWNKGVESYDDTWTEVTTVLNAFAGSTIQLRLDFDTYDSSFNSGMGIFIDALTITTNCELPSCAVSSDCSDSLSETTDLCDAGFCSYVF